MYVTNVSNIALCTPSINMTSYRARGMGESRVAEVSRAHQREKTCDKTKTWVKILNVDYDRWDIEQAHMR